MEANKLFPLRSFKSNDSFDQIKSHYQIEGVKFQTKGLPHKRNFESRYFKRLNFLISHISQFITLMPGDIITTGTPAGVGMGMNPPDYLKDGDEMILKVENLGEQKLKVVKEK